MKIETRFDLNFLVNSQFDFISVGNYKSTRNLIGISDYNLVYAECNSTNDVNAKINEIKALFPFSALWIYIKETEAIIVIRPVGEMKLFLFSGKWDWNWNNDYFKEKIKLLKERFSPEKFECLFDVKAVNIQFYNRMWDFRLELATNLKSKYAISDFDAILISQHFIDRIIILLFCCESGIIEMVRKNDISERTHSKANAKSFFNILIQSTNKHTISRYLNEIFFSFLGKRHTGYFKIGDYSFDIPFVSADLFSIKSHGNNLTGNEIIRDDALEFDKFHFESLFSYLTDFIWLINDDIDLNIESAFSGILTSEILGYMYEKFVIALETMDLKKNISIDELKKQVKTKRGNKKIGAYYTPEDVVHFMISKTVFPAAFDKTKQSISKDNRIGKDMIKNPALSKSELAEIKTFKEFWTLYKEDADMMKRFLDNLLSLRILDPSVGSGHFLLAVADEIFKMAKICKLDIDTFKLKKHIAEDCLYGVDVLPGAVEICKLRIWLWILSEHKGIKSLLKEQIDSKINYKIRTGNSLIGIIKPLITNKLDNFLNQSSLILEIESLNGKIAEYKTSEGYDLEAISRLETKFQDLNKKFDEMYVSELSINKSDIKDLNPFHWILHFYEVFKSKDCGFDVILGNPPWGTKVLDDREKRILKKLGFRNTVDIAGAFVQREIDLLKNGGYFAQILPDSIIPNSDMSTVRDLILEYFNAFYLAYFGTRPGKLFEGIEKRAAIGFGKKEIIKSDNRDSRFFTTKALLFLSEERPYLLKNLEFQDTDGFLLGNPIGEKGNGDWILPKIGSSQTKEILSVLKSQLTERKWGLLSDQWIQNPGEQDYGKPKLMIRESAGYWINALVEFPYDTSMIKTQYFESELIRDFALLLINSHLMYLFWSVYGNFHHVPSSLIGKMPFPTRDILEQRSEKIRTFRVQLSEDLLKNFRRSTTQKDKEDGTKGRDGQFQTGLSKPILEEIELLIGEIYGFSEKQINYLINYDGHIRNAGNQPPEIEMDKN